MYFIDYKKNPAAAQAFLNSWAHQYASWGVDYLKIDGVHTSDQDDVIAWSKALNQTGRTIHFGLSNTLDFNNVKTWQKYANGWRISGDIECYCTVRLTHWGFVGKRWDTLTLWAISRATMLLGADLTNLDRCAVGHLPRRHRHDRPDGTGIELWKCNGGGNQKWSLKIRSDYTPFCDRTSCLHPPPGACRQPIRRPLPGEKLTVNVLTRYAGLELNTFLPR